MDEMREQPRVHLITLRKTQQSISALSHPIFKSLASFLEQMLSDLETRFNSSTCFLGSGPLSVSSVSRVLYETRWHKLLSRILQRITVMYSPLIEWHMGRTSQPLPVHLFDQIFESSRDRLCLEPHSGLQAHPEGRCLIKLLHIFLAGICGWLNDGSLLPWERETLALCQDDRSSDLFPLLRTFSLDQSSIEMYKNLIEKLQSSSLCPRFSLPTVFSTIDRDIFLAGLVAHLTKRSSTSSSLISTPSIRLCESKMITDLLSSPLPLSESFNRFLVGPLKEK